MSRDKTNDNLKMVTTNLGSSPPPKYRNRPPLIIWRAFILLMIACWAAISSFNVFRSFTTALKLFWSWLTLILRELMRPRGTDTFLSLSSFAGNGNTRTLFHEASHVCILIDVCHKQLPRDRQTTPIMPGIEPYQRSLRPSNTWFILFYFILFIHHIATQLKVYMLDWIT